MSIALFKPRLPFVAALLFVMAVYLVWSTQPESIRAEPPMAPPKNEYGDSVAAVGLVEPSSENIALSTPVPGLVEEVYISAGEQVSKGDALFRLEARDLQAELKVREQQLQKARVELARLQQMPRQEEIPPAAAQVREAEQALNDAQVQQELIEKVKDPRAIKQEDLLRRRIATRAAQARLDSARAELQLLKAGAWQADIAVVKEQIALAERQVQRIETEIDRRTITAPRDGRILQLNIRSGEYAQAGRLPTPLILFGDVSDLHVRADVDEREGWKVQPQATAYAVPRGHTGVKIPLEFVRFEPYVVPKKQLTGDVTERVDTRVLQVIYKVSEEDAPIFVGQQVDVYINQPQADDRVAGVQ